MPDLIIKGGSVAAALFPGCCLMDMGIQEESRLQQWLLSGALDEIGASRP